MLSVIVPSYNEDSMIELFHETTTQTLTNLEYIKHQYEIIFVDDGSTDQTWEKIKELIKKDSKVHGIKFSRNFGKEAAIFAGLQKAAGDCVIIMDCDLQHPPEYIDKMYQHYLNGFQIVRCKKHQRNKESLLKTLCNSLFFRFFGFFDSTQLSIANASDYQLIDRKVVNYILKFQET